MTASQFTAIRARFRDILLGSYGVEYPIPADLFHLAAVNSTPETHPRSSLERAVWITLGEGEAGLSAGRTAGYVVRRYALRVRVAYVLTGAGDSGAESLYGQSGAGDLESIEDRADADRQRIESAFGSWQNTGGLTPHVIDCAPVAGGGVEPGEDRVILSADFSLLVRLPLAVA